MARYNEYGSDREAAIAAYIRGYSVTIYHQGKGGDVRLELPVPLGKDGGVARSIVLTNRDSGCGAHYDIYRPTASERQKLRSAAAGRVATQITAARAGTEQAALTAWVWEGISARGQPVSAAMVPDIQVDERDTRQGRYYYDESNPERFWRVKSNELWVVAAAVNPVAVSNTMDTMEPQPEERATSPGATRRRGSSSWGDQVAIADATAAEQRPSSQQQEATPSGTSPSSPTLQPEPEPEPPLYCDTMARSDAQRLGRVQALHRGDPKTERAEPCIDEEPEPPETISVPYQLKELLQEFQLGAIHSVLTEYFKDVNKLVDAVQNRGLTREQLCSYAGVSGTDDPRPNTHHVHLRAEDGRHEKLVLTFGGYVDFMRKLEGKSSLIQKVGGQVDTSLWVQQQSAATAASGGSRAQIDNQAATRIARLKEELGGLKMMALVRKARDHGVDEAKLDAVDDMSEVIPLILEQVEKGMVAEEAVRIARLKEELGGLKMMALVRKARDHGVDEAKLDAVDDMSEIIPLILEQSRSAVDDASAAEIVNTVQLVQLDRTNWRDDIEYIDNDNGMTTCVFHFHVRLPVASDEQKRRNQEYRELERQQKSIATLHQVLQTCTVQHYSPALAPDVVFSGQSTADNLSRMLSTGPAEYVLSPDGQAMRLSGALEPDLASGVLITMEEKEQLNRGHLERLISVGRTICLDLFKQYWHKQFGSVWNDGAESGRQLMIGLTAADFSGPCGTHDLHSLQAGVSHDWSAEVLCKLLQRHRDFKRVLKAVAAAFRQIIETRNQCSHVTGEKRVREDMYLKLWEDGTKSIRQIAAFTKDNGLVQNVERKIASVPAEMRRIVPAISRRVEREENKARQKKLLEEQEKRIDGEVTREHAADHCKLLLERFGQFQSVDTQYILIANRMGAQSATRLGDLGRVKWTAVIDLDPETASPGSLFGQCELNGPRRIQTYTPFHFQNAKDTGAIADDITKRCQWYFANGRSRPGDPSPHSDAASWVDDNYKQQLNEFWHVVLTSINHQAPLRILVADFSCSDSATEGHSQIFAKVVGTLLGGVGHDIEDCVKDGLVASHSLVSSKMRKKCDEVFTIPPAELGITLRNLLANRFDDGYKVNGPLGQPVVISKEDYNVIQEMVEVLFHGCETAHLQPDQDGEISAIARAESVEELRENFLQSKHLVRNAAPLRNIGRWEGMWLGFDAGMDVQRTITAKVKQEVIHYLETMEQSEDTNRPRCAIVRLYHLPSAGASTIARRVLWDVHSGPGGTDVRPCVVVRRMTNKNIGGVKDAIVKLYGLVQRPILILMDKCAGDDELSSREEQIGNALSDALPKGIAVILQCVPANEVRARSQTLAKHAGKAIRVPDELDAIERKCFADKYCVDDKLLTGCYTVVKPSNAKQRDYAITDTADRKSNILGYLHDGDTVDVQRQQMFDGQLRLQAVCKTCNGNISGWVFFYQKKKPGMSGERMRMLKPVLTGLDDIQADRVFHFGLLAFNETYEAAVDGLLDRLFADEWSEEEESVLKFVACIQAFSNRPTPADAVSILLRGAPMQYRTVYKTTRKDIELSPRLRHLLVIQRGEDYEESYSTPVPMVAFKLVERFFESTQTARGTVYKGTDRHLRPGRRPQSLGQYLLEDILAEDKLLALSMDYTSMYDLPRELFLNNQLKPPNIQIVRHGKQENKLNFSLLVEVLKNDSHKMAVDVLSKVAELVADGCGTVQAHAHIFYTHTVRLILIHAF
eukprot:COSAG01_NODE_1238_length_11092_cov_20.966433_5_plen_1732_part_00